jgi:hypothetical protein
MRCPVVGDPLKREVAVRALIYGVCLVATILGRAAVPEAVTYF